MQSCKVTEPRRQVWLNIWATLFLVGGLLSLSSLAYQAVAQQKSPGSAIALTVDGTISPATMDYIVRGIEQAEADGAQLVVLQMDTPGGLMESTREIIKTILASSVPVATYVTPQGARAASAGTYILYASHVAAMSPATNLGSATPVQMGGLPGTDEAPSESPSGDNETDATGEDSEASENSNGQNTKRRGETPMERKVLEDAVSYIRGLADRHGRNADWAEKAVRDAVNLSAREALNRNVIDVVATSVPDLLQQIDGRTLRLASGEVTLKTAGLEIVSVQPDWRTRLLSVITHPNVAYFLMIIGFYGIIFELANPGALVPGVVGAICLILALFAFQVLSVNYAGLALLLLGLGFIVGEAFMPSFGMLGIGGIVAFIAGSVILMDGSHRAISLPAIGGTAAVAAGFILWTVTRFMGLRKRRPVTGSEQIMQEQAVALDDFAQDNGNYLGHVLMSGERWKATSRQPVKQGDTLRVTAVDGLTISVEAAGTELVT